MKKYIHKLIIFIAIFIIGNELKAQNDIRGNNNGSDTLIKDSILKLIPTFDIRKSNQNFNSKTDSVILSPISNPNLLIIKKEGSNIVLTTPISVKPKPKLIVSNGHWSWEVGENDEITQQNLEKSVTKFKFKYPDIYEKLNCDEAIIIEIAYSEFISLMPEKKQFILAHPELYKLLPK